MMDGFINTIWVYCFISYLTISNILIHGCETNYMIQKFSKFGDELTLTENDRIFIQKLRRSSWQKCPKLSPYFKSYIAQNWHRLSRKMQITSAKMYFYLKNFISNETITFNAYIAVCAEWVFFVYLALRIITVGIMMPIEAVARFAFIFFLLINIFSSCEPFFNLTLH